MRNQIRTAGNTFELHSFRVLEEDSLGATDHNIAGSAAAGSGEEGAGTLPVSEFPGISAERLAMLLRTDPRDDSDVRSDVLRALMLDSLVPLSVDAQVQDGIVTLTGTVSWHHERKDAIYLAGCVPGVLGVTDNLVLIPAPRDGEGR
jgi:BON domain